MCAVIALTVEHSQIIKKGQPSGQHGSSFKGLMSGN